MQSTIHEIRNQLAVAIANLEAFIDGKFKPTPDRLNSVLAALFEVDVLIDDLPRESASPASPALETIDVCGLIESELVAIEAASARAGVELRVDRCAKRHPDCMAFVCDPRQVSQVVKNVLLNAIKYTPRGGSILVDCHREPGVLALSVNDDGPGVASDERLTIFEPGVRGSASAELPGTGLGLAVVKHIVDTHGGTVSVDRSALGGAEFVVRLPGRFDAAQNCARCGERCEEVR